MNNKQQLEVCEKFGADFFPASQDLKAGVALNVKDGLMPINGLRHHPEGDTTGWYIWSGEILSQEPDFFHPLHVKHLNDLCPQILKYLGLPPGWRFLVDGDFEDVWFDESLIR